MHSSITLGRVRGIEVGLNWSWLIVFALIVWTLAAGVFPDQNPGLADGTYLAMAAVAAALFFASILAHELGHALQARREGMQIDGITLWLFGGVAKFKGMFPSAGAELRIAVAGPAVSAALTAAFVALAWLVPLPAQVDGVLAWLGYINLVLLVFNLLPALPLDGGRIARAALWHLRGDFGQATRVAAGLGRAFGQVLILAGLIAFFFGGLFGGAWLAFIGWFLLGAAEAERQHAVARTALADLRVADLMISEPTTVAPHLSVEKFVEDVFFPRRHSAYPVVDRGRPLGLISFRNTIRLPREQWPQRMVREVMVPLEEVTVLPPERSASEALTALAQSQLNRALVCRGDDLVGLLSLTDVARALEARTAAAGMGRAGPATERASLRRA